MNIFLITFISLLFHLRKPFEEIGRFDARGRLLFPILTFMSSDKNYRMHSICSKQLQALAGPVS